MCDHMAATDKKPDVIHDLFQLGENFFITYFRLELGGQLSLAPTLFNLLGIFFLKYIPF